MPWLNTCKTLSLFSVLLMTPLLSFADVAVGVSASTLGLGGQITVGSATSPVNGRALFNTFSTTHNFEEDGVHYNAKVDLNNYGLLLDWYPFHGAFRLSAGGLHNGNQFKLTADCKQPCDIDGHTYRSSTTNAGEVTGVIDFKTFAPYVGFGWGNAMHGNKLYMGLDIGVMLQDTPQVSLSSKGTFYRDNSPIALPIPKQELANEQASLQQDLKDSHANLYPVIDLSLGYRF